MHVDHLRAGVVYPVVADPAVTDAAAIVADWLCALAFADNPEGYISYCLIGDHGDQDERLQAGGANIDRDGYGLYPAETRLCKKIPLVWYDSHGTRRDWYGVSGSAGNLVYRYRRD